jgi:hypothetical protein
MSLKRKEIVAARKASFEKKLKDRLADLAGKGIKPPRADRDTVARMLKAEVKTLNKRLARIAELDKRTEELARAKAEKAAAPKKHEEAAKAPKPKAAPKDGKPKKEKAPEGAKGEAKPPKKKPEEAKEAPAAPAKPEA